MISEFLNEGFPIFEPKRRFRKKSSDSRFKPFLGHILEIGQGKIDSSGAIIEVRQTLEI